MSTYDMDCPRCESAIVVTSEGWSEDRGECPQCGLRYTWDSKHQSRYWVEWRTGKEEK